MTKREKAIAETKAQLEAQREFQRFYVELAQACPSLSADEVIALGDELMELVAALPPKKRMREGLDALHRSVMELVHRYGYVLDLNYCGPQSLWQFALPGDYLGSGDGRKIPIPELVPGDAETGG